jgi:hypothetical protein
MMSPIIHIHAQVDVASVGYVVFMWETMLRLANQPELIKLSVHCMDEGLESQINLPQTQVDTVRAPSGAAMRGSHGHGVAVEHAILQCDDGNIHVLANSDIAMVYKGWDDYTRHMIIDKGIGTFGATFEDIGGFGSGPGSVQMYKGSPNIIWMAMSPKHKWADLKACHGIGTNLLIATDHMSKVYNLQVGFELLRDVGWQIPSYLDENNISYVGLKHLKGSTGGTVLKGENNYHEEFPTPEGVPFLVHQRGARRNKFRNGDSGLFYAAVDRYLEVEYTIPTRWVWPTKD